VPGSANGGTGSASYHVEVTKTPNDVAGLLRLRSTGRVHRATRTIVVDLTKKSFLDYIYYTDKESSAPAALRKRYPTRVYPYNQGGYNAVKYGGLDDAERAKCDRYHYATTTTPARTASPSEPIFVSSDGGATWTDTGARSAVSCDIQFAAIDTISGPLHTNDAILVNGALFQGRTTTGWWRGTAPDATTTAQFLGTGASASGRAPVEGERVELPPSNAGIKDQTDPAKGGQDGCIYTGPTEIVLRDDGMMDVTSPLTQSTNAGCTTASPTAPNMSEPQRVQMPRNGVIYVQRSTQACSSHSLGFPRLPGDLTTYDCAAGDVFIRGTLSGRLTIAAFNDIDVTGNITYKGGMTGSDALGLIANDFVQVYHPVRCLDTVASGFTCPDNRISDIPVGMTDVTISAAILSVGQSFTVQNYDKGAKLGRLTVLGGIYQKYRGAVGTGGNSSSGTGYAKAYTFDSRLRSLPPPYFLDPASSPWRTSPAGYAEVATPSGLPTP
jgi:hypothetical protein